MASPYKEYKEYRDIKYDGLGEGGLEIAFEVC